MTGLLMTVCGVIAVGIGGYVISIVTESRRKQVRAAKARGNQRYFRGFDHPAVRRSVADLFLEMAALLLVFPALDALFRPDERAFWVAGVSIGIGLFLAILGLYLRTKEPR